MTDPRKEILADGIEIRLGDCRDVLPLIGKVDAVVTDPPYGIGRDKGNSNCGRGFYATQIRKQYDDDWDVRPDDELIREIIGRRTAIVWGGNFFTSVLPVNGHWLVWDKQNTMPTFSDCELAWTNLPLRSVKKITYSNNGLMAREKDRAHPTQKPVDVMAWCVAMTAGIVLDPFMGSGSTGVACVNLGRSFIGIEIEPKYFDIARRRISEALSMPRLPFEEPVKVKQGLLFEAAS